MIAALTFFGNMITVTICPTSQELVIVIRMLVRVVSVRKASSLRQMGLA